MSTTTALCVGWFVGVVTVVAGMLVVEAIDCVCDVWPEPDE